MTRKTCSIIGIILLLSVLNSCSSPPEEGLLKRYFSALTMNDRMTLSTMAIEPISIDAQNWEIITVSEEVIEEFKLAEMDAAERELQKKLTDHVGPVTELDDELWGAKEDLKAARTGAARRAAKRPVACRKPAGQSRIAGTRVVQQYDEDDRNRPVALG